MKLRNIVLLGVMVLALPLHAARKKADSDATRGSTPQMVNTGVSLNQQLSSSSLNSTTAATISSGAASAGMFTIGKSGRYFLSTDLFAAPGGASTPVILINSSDVVLDLGGKSITLSTTIADRTCRAAIEIASGIRNITIMNGTINGTSGTTRRLDYGIVNPTSGSTTNSNIMIDNVNIIGCVTSNIQLAYVNNLHLNDVHTYGTPGNSLTSMNGLYLSNCNQGIVTDCSFNGGYGTSATAVYGVYAATCTNFTVDNVQVSNNSSTGAAAYGLYMNACTGFSCDNIRALKNGCSFATGTVYGMCLNASTGNIFTNCLANNNTHTGGATSGYAYGVRLQAASDGNSFTRCEAVGNTNNCTTAASETAGFSNMNNGYNLFQECTALNNSETAATTAVLAYGFVSTGTGTTIRSCKANGNNIASTSATATVHGISMIGETGGVIQNCEINANRVSASSGTAKAYGIRLRGSCIRCIVEYNKMLSNLGYNAAAQYGFYDAAADSTTFLRGNISFGHGKVFGGGESSLTETSTMNYYLDYSESGDSMNIQMLIKEGDISNMNAFEAGSPTWFNFSIIPNAISG